MKQRDTFELQQLLPHVRRHQRVESRLSDIFMHSNDFLLPFPGREET